MRISYKMSDRGPEWKTRQGTSLRGCLVLFSTLVLFLLLIPIRLNRQFHQDPNEGGANEHGGKGGGADFFQVVQKAKAGHGNYR